MEVKRIGVLTSGGDAPGMNAAVRAVVRTGLSYGMEVCGILKGYNGLINKDVIDMNQRSVSAILHRGGTVLYTARCLEFKTEEGMAKAIANCKELGIQGIVVIGGDGSYRGARDLSERGIPCVGIPGTIDNDIASTYYSIGYDTAMNTAVEMIDKLRDTMQSHDRCSVVEVMGRHAGHLALEVGLAAGATCILLPEIENSIDRVIKKINDTQKLGKHHFIIVMAEGVDDEIRANICGEIIARTGIDTRLTVLGHVQRGGNPTARDRVMASRMGYHAVGLLNKGIGNRVVCYSSSRIFDMDIFEALNMKKEIDMELYKMADLISI